MRNGDISHRQQKVAILINNALIEVLRQGKILDSRLINCPLTITKITVTGDLKAAYCYFLPFNTNLKEADLSDALNKSKYAIRSLVTKKIQLKYSPEIHFYYDHGFDNASKVDALLKSVTTQN